MTRSALEACAGLALAAALVGPIATAWAGEGLGALGYAALYGRMLEQHTRAVPEKVGTRVDYRGLLEDPRWKELVARLAAVDPELLQTREERLAFWINAYNILAIDIVLSHYPVKSIRDIGTFFSPVWKMEAGRIVGKARSLKEIEHAILRPLGEPRIHAAIVCASISCPDLRREPFEPERLEVQLDEQLRSWLANPQKGSRLDAASGTLTLSPILHWFEEDFETHGGVVEYIVPYLPDPIRRRIAGRRGELALAWFDYDWGLND
ncbi:MAG: DUF547 domain-containing protein [Deltaproteobacteria bacterium]|nr:DUF547 domain-containing protein [Deltaproteobacteria bacterium]MBW2419289.1 DUF547 domain-containing protein [Deltaproteobacteria bacterium]